MDIKTTIIGLAIGNFVFGAALILFQLREDASHRNSFWTAAKLFQGVGWFLLCFRGVTPDLFSYTLGNSFLLSGIAYECWAMYQMSLRTVSRRIHVATTICITLICLLSTPLPSSARIAIASFVACIFFCLSGIAILGHPLKRTVLRLYTGFSMCLVSLIIFLRGVTAVFWPEGFVLFSENAIQFISFATIYYLMLANGFGVLMLAKEATDQELKRALKEQKAVFDTLPTGLCILKDRGVERCNPALESMFGFEPGTMVGKSVRCVYENDDIFEDIGRKMYADIKANGYFKGEVPCVRQNGERFWAWYQGSNIFPDRAHDYSVFSVTDISEHKKLLEELTQQKEEMEKTLSRMKRLEGIISICMYCKKIRNAQSSWDQLEKYISEHSDALFSHGICPECYESQRHLNDKKL